jgi:hypothetical protein
MTRLAKILFFKKEILRELRHVDVEFLKSFLFSLSLLDTMHKGRKAFFFKSQ